MSDLSFTDLGLKICDYAKCEVSVNAPIVAINGNNVTITPALVCIRFIGGNAFGHPDGQHSSNPLIKAIPTTIYYQ